MCNNFTASCNFLRSHLRRPEIEIEIEIQTAADVIIFKSLFRLPFFVNARNQDKFCKITEKIFTEEL